MIPSHYYTKYNVKRGLRNADGTGVLAGLTSIGEVHGYVIDEGTKSPIEGKLRYRGIDVEDIVANCRAEKRFGFEEVAFRLCLASCQASLCLTSLKDLYQVTEFFRLNSQKI